MMPAPAIAKSPDTYRAFKIKPQDTNWFIPLLDPVADGVSFTWVVEVFAPGGATPPNTHEAAEEAFLVLRGRGVARVAGQAIPLSPGACFVVRAGEEHVVENPGPDRLYCLTVMAPDEGFAALIRNGTPWPMDDEDRAVVTGLAAGG